MRSGCAVGTRCEWWEQDALAASEHTFHLKTVHMEPRKTRVGEELASESVNAPTTHGKAPAGENAAAQTHGVLLGQGKKSLPGI